jgi:ATP phosphoribosyltransferase
MITLAIQKSGRLSDKTINLLQECGIDFNGLTKGSLKIKATNFPLNLLLMRDDDIPECVANNIAQIGIVGENTLLEKGFDLKISKRLGFAKCRLSLAVPKKSEIINVSDLNGKKIATSYPAILKSFLKKENLSSEIHEISGSVEIAPSIGLAEAIFDIVSSGSTLMTNGLKELHTVMKSEAVLIQSKKLTDEEQDLISKLVFRIEAVYQAKHNKYIILNAPNKALDTICDILPGMKSPTITPLASEGWSALYSVIEENAFWENIDKLKKAGAQGILVVPIEKMIR